MASPAQITEIPPETLPGDFLEWDEPSSSAQPVQSGSGEPGSGVGVVSKQATQAAEAHLAGAPSGNLARGEALSISALENTGGAAVPHQARSLSPAWLSWRDLVVLVVVLAVAMVPVLFRRELDTFDGYGFSLGRVSSAKPAAPPAPTITTIQQPQDAAPTLAHLTPTVPASSGAATTAGEVQIRSEAARQPVQKNARPSREQAQMMDDQLHTPTRLQMKPTLAEQVPPGGFAAAEIDGLDNNNTIGAVFGGPKQTTEQIASQQVISVPSGVALGLLIQKTQPVYPLIAKQGRVSGTIVLAATISKTGNIGNLRVVSGPVMLRLSAVNAVRTWRFKPYMLDNQPTAIETTINVRFCLPAESCVPGAENRPQK